MHVHVMLPLRCPGVACGESLLLLLCAKTQVLLVGHELHPLQGLKLIAPAALLCLGFLSLVLESPMMIRNGALDIALQNWPTFLLAATLGLAVNLLGNVIIQLSGSTALKLLATVRGPIVVLSGVLLFAETVSTLELCGYSVALVGFVW